MIGASQFTVQVSGKTIYLPRPGLLPVHNVPVVHAGRSLDAVGPIDIDGVAAAIGDSLARLDAGGDTPVAIALSWTGDPDYPRLAAAGRAIAAALSSKERAPRRCSW